MASISARTVHFIAAIILACVSITSGCTQAEVTPAVQPTTVDPLISSTDIPQPTPNPTRNQTASFFQGPLSVSITRPLDNETVQDSPVKISGQAEPETVVTINDNIILVDNSRAFTLQLDLKPGANVIEITASDTHENQGFAYLTLYYDPKP